MNDYYKEAERVLNAEADAIHRALGQIGESFGAAMNLLLATRGKLVFTGVGKSGIIAHKIAATVASTGTNAVFMSAADALHGDLGVVHQEDTVVMLSNSGATVELARMIPSLRNIGAKILGIFGKKDSPLSGHCDAVMVVEIEETACPLGLAPMASTTAVLAVGDALASALMTAKGFQTDSFAVYHPSGMLGRKLLLKVRDVMIMGDKLPIVSPDADLKQVLIAMTRNNIGAVCVCDEPGRLVGFVSDGDIRRLVIDGVTLSAKAADFMTKKPVTAGPEHSLGEILDIMENPNRKIYVIPVCAADGTLQGIVRMHDIIGAG